MADLKHIDAGAPTDVLVGELEAQFEGLFREDQ